MTLKGIDGGKKDLDRMSKAERLFETVVSEKLKEVGSNNGCVSCYVAVTSDNDVASKLAAIIADNADQTVANPWTSDLPPDLNLFAQIYENRGTWYVSVFSHTPPDFKLDQPTHAFKAKEWGTDPYKGLPYYRIWDILEAEHGVYSKTLSDFKTFVDLLQHLLYQNPSTERFVEIKVEMLTLSFSFGPNAARAVVRDFLKKHRNQDYDDNPTILQWLLDFAPETITTHKAPRQTPPPPPKTSHLSLVKPLED